MQAFELATSLQIEATEWRYSQPHRLREAVSGNGIRIDAAAVADIAAAVQLAVAVENLNISARRRDADAVVTARDGREVEDHHQEVQPIVRVPDHRDDAVFVVVAVDPAESVVGEVALVERRFRRVVPVQVLHEAPQFGVERFLEHVPVEALVVAPFVPLPELIAHEQQLLARMAVHVSVKRAERGVLLPDIAGYPVKERSLPVHYFV